MMPDLQISDVGGRRKWQQNCVKMLEGETERRNDHLQVYYRVLCQVK